ncbi:MAG TPA: hypothetical protein VFX00_00190 [Pedococcus sp.]|nr:hypothetical protein [Pedococcus sp.]
MAVVSEVDRQGEVAIHSFDQAFCVLTGSPRGGGAARPSSRDISPESSQLPHSPGLPQWHDQNSGSGTTMAITDTDSAVAGQSAVYRTQRAIATALTVWGVGYACYRAYYAAGGEIGMIGKPMSDAQFRAVNAAGAGIVLLGALLPLVLVRAAPLRPATPTLAWIVGVGCCMHALVDGVLRLLSLIGMHPTQLPAELWQSFDRRTADLQDVLLNEPWFLVEGLLWVALGVASIQPSRRRPWLASAAGACLLLTVVGILSGLDVIGSFRIG